MFDAAAARGGFPVLLPRRIDFPAAPTRSRFCRPRHTRRPCGFGASSVLHSPLASRLAFGSELIQETGRAVTNSCNLLLEPGRIHPAVGLGLDGADQST